MDRGRGRARGQQRPDQQSGQPRPGQGPPRGGAGQGPPRGGPGQGAPRGGPGQGPPPSSSSGGAWGGNARGGGGGGIPRTTQPFVKPQGAWGQQGAAHQVRNPTPQPTATHHGRATFRGTGEPAPGPSLAHQVEVISGAGDAGAVVGAHSGSNRGAIRGRRQLPENIIITKPGHVASKKGSAGKQIRLSANYFQLLQRPDWCLFQYRVDFAPDDDHTGNRRKLLRTAIKTMDLSGYIFDGTVMYSPRRIEPNPLELFVDPINEGGEKVRVTIRLVGDVSNGDYHYIQIFNLIMRKCMSFLKLQLVGRNFFDPGARIVVPNWNLELWPGYVTSIRQHESNILMCCEITHKIMRNETVYDLLMECSNQDYNNYRRLFHERIVGATILTDYNNKTYRIDDVDFSTNPTSKFEKKDGSAISYKDYFRERYGLNISRNDQPMLISISKPREIRAGLSEKILLVPELCRMTGLTEQQRTNMQLMRSLATYTRVGPQDRIEKLHNFSRRLNSQPEIINELKQWDLKLANQIVEFAGRVLPMEKLYGDPKGNNEYVAGADVDWTKNVRCRKQVEDVPLRNWTIMYTNRSGAGVQSFAGMLKKAAQGLQWNVAEPRYRELPDDRVNTYLGALEEVANTNPALIMCVVSNNKADRYNAIKKKCCVDRAIPTQIIQARNLDGKGAMSIATKVAIQMNCKLGGAPWTVAMPLKGLMVVGYDVCHDPSDKSRSYGAMVASLNTQVTRYYSTISAHTSGEELSNDFALNLIKACKEYQTINNALPDRILIYRDGVGDGQIQYVHEHEIGVLKKELEKYYSGKKDLKMAFIVVSKRINTRIFCNGKNPEPGTVIDDVVTLPERYDFFIVSQCTRQGTVSPTSYNILYDSFGLSADKLQILTYKFTHMYFNWSGTVRVPAPCQYAHKLAFLVAQSLRRTPNAGLERLLYYL